MIICPCDERIHPAPLSITAGLPNLPRQIAGFPEFRAAMLAGIPTQRPLAAWRARGEGDLGLMLLEMWAYVCDVIAFYDGVFANEAYFRTAAQRGSLAALAALLGYKPRPAIAAAVRLGLLADGRQPVAIPAGTAFRSGAFAGSPPQVFEVDAAASAYPDLNKLSVVPPRPTTVSGTLSSLLLPAAARVREGKLIAFRATGGAFPETQLTVARKAVPTVEADGARYLRVEIDPITLGLERKLTDVELLQPSNRAGLWSRPRSSGDPALNDNYNDTGDDRFDGFTRFLLNGLYRQIGIGDLIVAEMSGVFRDANVVKIDEPLVTVAPGATIGSGSTAVTTPAAKVQATRLWLDSEIPDPRDDVADALGFADPQKFVLHHGFTSVGKLVAPAATTLRDGDPLLLAGVPASPVGAPDPKEFLLASADQRGFEVPGGLDFTAGLLTPAAGAPAFSPPVELPVTVYGNVVSATRGESVTAEVLGGGDASLANQSFKLQKKPLTFVPSATAQSDWAASSTLQVKVDGLTWSEAPGFYSAGPDDRIYVVALDEDGGATVSFGDGIHGARLPTGVGNVVASYRFGAGKASPPAFSIRQLVKPVPGLRSVVNPVAAAGGADAEGASVLRSRAPRSALLLGRAVSILDLQAAAAGVAGVRSASAEWRWSEDGMRPVVQIYLIGDAGLLPLVAARLRGLSDPSTPISVEVAQAVPVDLAIDLETDPLRNAADVVAAAQAALLAPGEGLLEPEQLGVGGPLFRSALFRAVLGVTGARGVRAVTWDGDPFDPYGKTPGAGRYFDFETTLTVTGAPNG